MYDYVLQLGFDEETEKYIRQIKTVLKENDIPDKEKPWRPHITIDLYNCANREFFISQVTEIIKDLKTFTLTFSNLNNFNEETLYIEPFNKEELDHLKELFDIKLNTYRLPKRLNRPYRPHVTLCTNDNLTKAKEIATNNFKPFKGYVKYLWIYTPKLELIKEYELGGLL